MLDNFMISLKATWIRRMVTKSNKYLNLVSELFPLTTCKSNVGSDFVTILLIHVTLSGIIKFFLYQAISTPFIIRLRDIFPFNFIWA